MVTKLAHCDEHTRKDSEMEYNAGQLEGIEKVSKWFSKLRSWDVGNQKQVFFLSGEAGTGKTTFARGAIEALGLRDFEVVYIAPTGKAASRLRQKGCTGAKTLHQFVYNVRGEDEEGDPIFVEKGSLDHRPRVVVLDEGSMVGRYDMDALTGHRIPVLALGDLGQLQPVKAPPSLTPDNIDHELTEPMRFRNADGSLKDESNIVRGARFIRKGHTIPLREYEDVRIRRGTAPLEQLLEHATEEAQILCSYNNTRIATNNRIREALGFKGNTPMTGEKVMCWFNQHGKNFMNGEQGIVIGYEDVPEDDIKDDDADEMMMIVLKSLTDGRTRKVKFNPLSFDPDPEVYGPAIKAPGGFQFGYAATIHKAQGSEWDNVLMIEEPMGDVSKLFYTGWTRAARRLTVYRR